MTPLPAGRVRGTGTSTLAGLLNPVAESTAAACEATRLECLGNAGDDLADGGFVIRAGARVVFWASEPLMGELRRSPLWPEVSPADVMVQLAADS